MKPIVSLPCPVMALVVCAAVSAAEPYALTKDSLPQPGVPTGTVSEFTWDNSRVYPDTIRRYWVFVPAQYDRTKPACVMVFLDGQTYLDPAGDARATSVLDNLIHSGEMPVTIGIFIEPGQKKPAAATDAGRAEAAPSIEGKSFVVDGFSWEFGEGGKARVSGGAAGGNFQARYEQEGRIVRIRIGPNEHEAIFDGETLVFSKSEDQRSIEYDSLGDAYARFLLEEILPAVGATYSLVDDPAGRAICGISSGGICAFTAAWERPDAFSKVISHVGSFTNIRGGHEYPYLIRKTKPKPIRVFLQEGEHDLNIAEGDWRLANLQMESALKFAHYDYRFVMGDGGHDLKHGGAILPDTLRWLWRDYPGVKTKASPER